MKIIDLSITLCNDTQVYPWDPLVNFTQIFTLKEHGWNMTRFSMNTHDATHINTPLHAKENGKTLDDYSLQDYIWESILYEEEKDIQPWIWIIFWDTNISMELAQIIIKKRPKFVWLSNKFEFDLEVEKYLLENDILSFERLENTDLLPKNFTFYGIPLKIKKWDGSPIRAFAII